MKVAVMTCFNSDPYISLLFKKSFDVWKDEVDELHICIHGGNLVIDNLIYDIWKDEPKVILYVPDEKFTELGQAFDYMYPTINCDILATIDSDNFIFKSGVVRRNSFLALEYGVVGSKGQSCKPDRDWKIIADRNFGMVRINSMMSFWDRSKLDFEFSFQRKILRKGDEIKELGLKIEKKLMIDTMAELTIKFLHKYKTFSLIENDGSFYHVGGMSWFSRNFLKDGNKYFFNKDTRYDIRSFKAERLAWHLFAFDETRSLCKLDFLNKAYDKMIKKVIKNCGYKLEDINTKEIKKLWTRKY